VILWPWHSEYSNGILTLGDTETFQIALASRFGLRRFKPWLLQPTKNPEAMLELFRCLKHRKVRGALGYNLIGSACRQSLVLNISSRSLHSILNTHIIVRIKFRLSKNHQTTIVSRWVFCKQFLELVHENLDLVITW
jgi:hypothetical protein